MMPATMTVPGNGWRSTSPTKPPTTQSARPTMMLPTMMLPTMTVTP